MSHPLLTRAPHHGFPNLPFLGDLSLQLGRVHELCGPARRRLALMIAGQVKGDVFWIHSHWQRDHIHPDGFEALCDPSRMTIVRPKRPEDMLWAMEEILRAGTVPLVVAELPEPPILTPIRRLHLAAEQGAKIGSKPPLGLILTPLGGAAGVETRWSLHAAHHGEDPQWLLQRTRARMAPPAAWTVAMSQGQPVLAKH